MTNPVNAGEDLSETWSADRRVFELFREFTAALGERLASAEAMMSEDAVNNLLDEVFGHDGCMARAGGAK
jgi:hypothetical protein